MHFAQPRTPTPETSWNPRGGQPFKAWGGLRGYLGWVTTHGFRGRAGGDVTTTACPQSDQVRRSPPVKRHKLSAEPTATDHATPVSPRRPSIHITPPPSNRGTHLNAGCVAARRHGEGSGNCGRGGGGLERRTPGIWGNRVTSGNISPMSRRVVGGGEAGAPLDPELLGEFRCFWSILLFSSSLSLLWIHRWALSRRAHGCVGRRIEQIGALCIE